MVGFVLLCLIFGSHQDSLIGSLRAENRNTAVPSVEIKPDSVLGDEEVVIKLSGFNPDQEVTVKAQAGNWRSKAIFKRRYWDALYIFTFETPFLYKYKNIKGP